MVKKLQNEYKNWRNTPKKDETFDKKVPKISQKKQKIWKKATKKIV